ncbi:pentapeptide repeat-containing protein [Cryobacterium sinapicolor]|uniref:Pentapeptide repeat-containing protein n=1 Tax=Cryobacterium sinapicolor TaxID=1259236 RepID=A0ABY2JAL5_9MICO|nr:MULTISPECIES: pentapeptide repeat-containing protein [Cryobacterium]TFC84012.1 pentapeptide repeat-containing protein [Cryobacterium sp. TMT3-29-2]TFD00664.1 pentapeptide repeat-containing protein [Cryobacterium sinapicolor]
MTSTDSSDASTDDRSTLRANCADCFALCCTAFGFQKSADFPINKPAGTPCLNLADDFSCSIHDSLRARGFRGCTVFDCFGAGQYVSQNLFGGTSWKERPDTSAEMFSAFAVVRQLHEMLWYLVEAAERATTSDRLGPVAQLRREIQRALDGEASAILATDVERIRAEVRQALIGVSEEARGGYTAGAEADESANLHPSVDLVGRNLRSTRLCGADLRGAYLIAADLRRNDLAGVDLLGADLRDARVEGADLSNALFLTQLQVDAAQGDGTTVLPAALARPQHWLA